MRSYSRGLGRVAVRPNPPSIQPSPSPTPGKNKKSNGGVYTQLSQKHRVRNSVIQSLHTGGGGPPRSGRWRQGPPSRQEFRERRPNRRPAELAMDTSPWGGKGGKALECYGQKDVCLQNTNREYNARVVSQKRFIPGVIETERRTCTISRNPPPQ